jgi:hypothetical protein
MATYSAHPTVHEHNSYSQISTAAQRHALIRLHAGPQTHQQHIAWFHPHAAGGSVMHHLPHEAEIPPDLLAEWHGQCFAVTHVRTSPSSDPCRPPGSNALGGTQIYVPTCPVDHSQHSCICQVPNIRMQEDHELCPCACAHADPTCGCTPAWLHVPCPQRVI